MRLLFLLLLLAACPGPAVIESSRSCDDTGLDNALSEACDRWPGSCDVGQRMDFFCVTQEAIESSTRCGWMRDGDVVLHHCTMWPGTSLAYRGRVYVGPEATVAQAAYHEAQHWHLWGDVETNACQSHEPECGWEQ